MSLMRHLIFCYPYEIYVVFPLGLSKYPEDNRDHKCFKEAPYKIKINTPMIFVLFIPESDCGVMVTIRQVIKAIIDRDLGKSVLY